MEKRLYKRACKNLMLAAFLMITFMMASKVVYIAQRTELMSIFNMDDVSVNLGMTFYFIVYAIVQLALSLFISKINVKKYMVISISTACIITASLALSNGKLYFWLMLSVLGIFQAGVWACCMFFLTKHLPNCMLSTANTLMTCGFPAGTVVSYAIASLCVGLKVWWLSFVLVSVLFFLVLVCFLISIGKMEKMARRVGVEIDEEFDRLHKKNLSNNPEKKGNLVSIETKFSKVLYYAIVGVVCFLVYAIYSSIIDFIPSMLISVHNMDDSLSMLFSLVVPIGVVFGPMLIINLCEKYRNYYVVALIGSCILTVLGVIVLFGYSLNAVLAVVLLLVFALCSRAVCSIFETVIVARMKDQINAGSFAAYTNASASIGGAAAPAIMGITIGIGWRFTYAVVLFEIIAVTILIALLVVLFVAKKRKSAQNNEQI